MVQRRWGVEPTMFLYMMAYMLTSVVEEDLIVYKACRVTHKYSSQICHNISQSVYQNEKEIVQVTVSWFHMWENVASHTVPTLLAFFLGSWSDKVGRKIPLLLGLCGGLVYSSALLANSFMEDWRVEWILLTGALPCALTGGPLAVMMAAYSYLADTTSTENRTFRTTLLEVSYLITIPIGVALGSYLFNNVFNRSHGCMFALNCGCLICSIIYTWCALEWNTAKASGLKNKQISCISEPTRYDMVPSMKTDSMFEGAKLMHVRKTDDTTQTVTRRCNDTVEYSESQHQNSSDLKIIIRRLLGCAGGFVLYISHHVSESVKTLIRPRLHERRKLLYLCLAALAFYTFQREEKHSIYLYTQLKFDWNLATFSLFRTFQSVLYIIGLLVGVPLLIRVLRVRDTVIMMIGAGSHIAARLTFSLARSKETIYAGGALGSLGPIVAPVIRSSVSKLVPSYERGKVFALLSVCDMAVPLISGALYSLVYTNTLISFPQAVFLLTITSQIIVFLSAVWMECLLKGEVIKQAEEEETGIITSIEESNMLAA